MEPTYAQLLNAPIAADRLTLEPLTGEHAEALWAPMQDPAIYEWISASPPPSVSRLEASWRARESRLSPDGDEIWLGWAVRRTSDRAYVGKIDVSIEGLVATNVGYVFFPPFWGQGYAAEAILGVALHLDRLGIREQWATVTRGNDRSGRVLEQAGFRTSRILPDNDCIRGVMRDDIEYVRSR